MSICRIVLKHGLALLVAGSLQKKDAPVPPVSIIPPTTTTTPPQYGTPFTGVPSREDAMIYQVNMRAFSQCGNFAGLTARLDYIKAMGINVVYLMPIYPVGSLIGFNSPYAVKNGGGPA